MKRKSVERAAERLLKSRVNDGVRLAYMRPEELEGLDDMELAAVTEFRRSKDGSVEIKFLDRLAVLKWLMEMEENDPWAEQLYDALEGKE